MGVVANNPSIYDLVASSANPERIATGYAFTEGPIWHPDGYLLFSDIPGNARHKWSASGGAVEALAPSNKCNGMTLDADLNLIACEHATSRVIRARLAADGTEAQREVLASHYDGKELNSPNDVVVSRGGSIYFTDPTYGRHDAPYGVPRELKLDFRGVYRIPAGGGLELLANDFDAPNGLCFSPDERTLYVNDSELALIRRFDVEAGGSLSGGEVLIDGVGAPGEFDPGICDGMKCDEQGNIWVTGPYGIWVVSSDGEHLGTIEVEEHAANLNWGGPEWNVLYVTAMSSVYSVQCKVRGNPVSYMG